MKISTKQIDAVRYEKLTVAKDELFKIMNSMKQSWTRDTWILLHQLAENQNYIEMHKVIKHQRDSKTRQRALVLIARIITLSTQLKFAY